MRLLRSILFALLLCQAAIAVATDHFWVGGTGNISDATNHWSLASGGPPGAAAPTSADNCLFDDNSTTTTMTVTVDAAASCADFSILIANAAHKMTLSGSQALNVFGSWLNPGSTLFATTYNGVLTFAATTPGKTITTSGVTLLVPNTASGGINFNGVGGGWTLADPLTLSGSDRGIIITNGAFDTGGFDLNVPGVTYAATGTATLNLNGSTITIPATNGAGGQFWNFQSSAGLTLSAASATIKFTGGTVAASPSFRAAAGETYGTVNFAGQAGGGWNVTGSGFTINSLILATTAAATSRFLTVFGDFSVGTLTPNNSGIANRRELIASDTLGVQRTITVTTIGTTTDTDFRDIAIVGPTWTGTRMGNCGGNSGIAFDAPKTVFWNLAGSQFWSATGWAATSGGTPDANDFPLPQDTAKFDDAGSAGTVTLEQLWALPTIDMSGRTAAMTLAGSTLPHFVYGNITWFPSLTLTGTGAWTFAGRNTQTVTSTGVVFTQAPTINSPGGTVKIGDDFSIGALKLTVANGTFDDNGHNVTLGSFGWAAGTGGLTFNGGNWTVSGSGTAWDANTNVTSKTVTRNVATGQLQFTSASAKTMAGGGLTYPTLVQAGAGALTVQQSNRFNDLADTALPSTVTFTNATTTTFDNFTASGTSGNLLTINTPSAGNFATFSKASGTVSVSYVSLKDNHATGGAIWNAFTALNGNVNVSGNQGWNFAPFNGGGSFFNFFGDLSPEVRALMERAANDNRTELRAAA